MLRVLWDVNAHAHLLRRCSCTCTLVNYHHLPNMIFICFIWIKLIIFSRSKYLEQEKLSTEWDSKQHSLVSGQVPLPLDHLHSCFSLLFNSYPRASIVSNPGPWHIVHAHCMLRVLWDVNVHAHLLRRCSCTCTLVNYHHLPNMIFICFIWIKLIISLEANI